MNKKIIAIGMICMFLLTSLSVGNALGEKTTQTLSDSGKDLKIELITRTNWGNPIGLTACIGNTGTETINGPITVTLTIKRGFFGLKKFDEITFTFVADGSNLNPGASVWGGDWEPDPSISPGGIFTFQYKINII